MSNKYTCISCRVAFTDPELQRLHYKTDWHRYNLKRKVAELPPVTSEEFQRRVLNQRNNDEISNQDKSVYCDSCRKSFSNEKAFENHKNSKRHKDNVLNGVNVEVCDKPDDVEDDSTEEVDSDEWNEENPIDNNDCLFCLHHSRNLLKNLQHMTVAHTFFIPDIEYCVDVKGLLEYLGEKITQGYMCIWCNDKGKTFYSADSARQHMLDKGHCKMLHEGVALAEYADFYDYSASYPDATDNVDLDEEVEIPTLDDSDYQLVLPSGVTVGHRSLMVYYRQKLNPNSTTQVVKKNKKLHKVLAQYRALGWTETQQKEAAKKARDIHFMKRVQAKWTLKMGQKSNKIGQPHFRSQIGY